MVISSPSVLVTGANGFVGSRVCRRFAANGANVRAIVRRPGERDELRVDRVTEWEGDFTDPGMARRAAEGMAIVIHCAATSGDDLDDVRHVNAEGTSAIVNASIAEGCDRYIQISTAAVYNRGDREVIDEETPLKTDGDPYGLTKAEGDRIVFDAAERGLKTTVLRPGAILGAHPTSTWAVRIPAMIRYGEFTIPGDGSGPIPYLHVEDLVDAILLALGSDRAIGRAFNVGDGHVIWRRFVDDVRSWFDDAPEIKAAKEPTSDSPPPFIYSIDRIRRDLGYEPKRSYEEGMAEARQWWRENGG